MAACLNQVTFFFETDVHKWLLEHSENVKMELALEEGESFTLNVIDQPLCVMMSRDNKMLRIRIYIRKEIGIFEESPDLELAVPTDGGDGQVRKNSSALGGDPNQLLSMFYKAGLALRKYIFDHDLLEQCTGMAENEGLIVKDSGEELSFRRVSGKRRPDMAATSLFGGVKMCRAYSDEVMDHWDTEMLSEEEKIARAEDGDEDIMEMLAHGYLNGDELDEDPEKAAYWFRKLAELDSANAQFNLGLLYAKGHGVDRDFRQAAYWMQRAAENGDDDAPAVVQQYTLAADSREKADAGDAQAQADLAGVLMALAGSLDQAGTGDDYDMAFQLAQKSAAQNNGKGIWTLALAYEHGRGVEEDQEKAVELYRRGADLGDAACQHSLGCCYMNGDRVEKDSKKAFELFAASAEQGYLLAVKSVAACYQFGRGVMGNMKTACRWFEKALEIQPDPEIQQRVDLCHMLEQTDPNWGEDYPGDEDYDPAEDSEYADEEELDDSELPEGFAEAVAMAELAEQLGCEMGEQIDFEKIIAFMKEKAEAGDMQAKYVTAKFFLANDEQTELGEKWLQEAMAAGYQEE